MASTSQRALTLLSLLGSRGAWSGEELAGRLGVSTRTVRRDVETLRALGYPVHAGRGRGGSYRLGSATLPPLQLDEDQAVAVALALQTAPTVVAGVGDAAARALTSLRSTVSPRLRAEMDDVRITAVSNAWEFRAPPVAPQVLRAVGGAVRRSHLLRLDYLHPDGRRALPGDADFTPPLLVEPHELVVWAGRWYLLAYQPQAQQWTVYRVDRIRPLDPTGTPFARRALPAGDAGRYVRTRPDRGDTPARWQCTGSAVVAVPAELAARWAPGGSVVEFVTPGHTRITLSAWSWAGVAGLLATFDAPLQDVQPTALRDAMATVAERFGRGPAAT